jgi:predicted anti-sigma-YlaC factor YlaD
MSTVLEKSCERNLIVAYVDGELDQKRVQRLEDHLETCAACRDELRAHRLFVCELDAALTDGTDIPVPVDFSRMVAAVARSDMRGVRTGSENRKALAICMILALSGLALLGGATRFAVFVVVEKFVMKVFSLVEFFVTAVYDVVVGLVVILKVLSGRIQLGWSGPLLVLLAAAVLVLSRLLSHYHRPGATE